MWAKNKEIFIVKKRFKEKSYSKLSDPENHRTFLTISKLNSTNKIVPN